MLKQSKHSLLSSVTCLLHSLCGTGNCSTDCQHYLIVPAAPHCMTGLIHTNYEVISVRKDYSRNQRFFFCTPSNNVHAHIQSLGAQTRGSTNI